MHFHVIGLGPIGSLLAHNLRSVLPAAHRISLIHKTPAERTELAATSLKVIREGNTTSSSNYSHESFDWSSKRKSPVQPRQDSSPGPIDSLFVALKAQQTVNAVKTLAPRLSPNSTIVLLQNGMGVYEELLSRVFRNPEKCPHFILASNTHGAFISDRFTTIHAGIGSIDFSIVPDPRGRDFEAGLHDESVNVAERRLKLSDLTSNEDQQLPRYRTLRDTVAALLLLKPLNTMWRPYSELQILLRRKLAVNAVVNPLTSLLNCPNGDLLDQPTFPSILQDICDEASAVFSAQLRHDTHLWLQELKAQGHDTHHIPESTIPDLLTSESLQKEVRRVINITRGNISSTLQDIRRGRDTEIDYLNGYLRDAGKNHGVATPVNTTLCNLVKLRSGIPVDRML
ncbi:hypothetical protein CVT24_005346 [Panaeolus cyanescens]|uniref:2-dehydropantoate 2-reductase n=1 Tax=Panaeolus cyanescens TaxID=181874 RepID=A0A409Y9A9_9AGAR|nr:hypothetical protein CVT24_005346 [Panaeolus cyanescens]